MLTQLLMPPRPSFTIAGVSRSPTVRLEDGATAYCFPSNATKSPPRESWTWLSRESFTPVRRICRGAGQPVLPLQVELPVGVGPIPAEARPAAVLQPQRRALAGRHAHIVRQIDRQPLAAHADITLSLRRDPFRERDLMVRNAENP